MKFKELFGERDVTSGVIMPKTITGTPRDTGDLLLADKPTKTLVFYDKLWEYHLTDGGCDKYGDSLVNINRVNGQFIAKSITVSEDSLRQLLGEVLGDLTDVQMRDMSVKEEIKTMDERFEQKMKDTAETDGDYRKYKKSNDNFIFYDDLSFTEKRIVIQNKLNFDLIGRLSREDTLITKKEFAELKTTDN